MEIANVEINQERTATYSFVNTKGESPEVDQESNSATPSETEVDGASEAPKLPLEDIEDKEGIDSTSPSLETMPSTQASDQELQSSQSISSSLSDVDNEDYYETFPNNVQIEEIKQGAQALRSGSTQKYSKTYDRVAAFFNITEEEYSSLTLDEAVAVVREYSVLSETIGGGAIAETTFHNIQEGRILLKTKKIDKKVNGPGWDKRALNMFPYSKSTRCARMNIASIEGVDQYCIAGTERLRAAASAISNTGVQGPDQIKSLFELFGESCDLNCGHLEFNEKFDMVLAKAKQIMTQVIAPHTMASTDEGESKKSTVCDKDENQKASSQDNGSAPCENQQKENNSGDSRSELEEEEEQGEGGDQTNPDEKDSFLNQSSLNRCCGRLIKTIESLQVKTPQIQSGHKFNTSIIDDAINKLNGLKQLLLSLPA